MIRRRPASPGLIHAVVSDDPDRTWAEIGDNVSYQLHSYMRYALDEGVSVPAAPSPAELRAMGEHADAPGIFPNFVVVTPDDAAKLLRERAPVGAASTEAFFWSSVAGMSPAICERHIELLATRVKPLVADI